MTGHGVIRRYREFLPVSEETHVVTLNEGGTPLIEAPGIVSDIGGDFRLFVKYEGLNPTASFKDRGMTLAVTKAAERGASIVVCASTGNTSASAAAYAAAAGMTCLVLIPEGKIAYGKMAQALIHGARTLEVRGNFDDALEIVRRLGERDEIEVPPNGPGAGVELMLRNKKKTVGRQPKSVQFKFEQMVSLFRREFHIHFDFSIDVKRVK